MDRIRQSTRAILAASVFATACVDTAASHVSAGETDVAVTSAELTSEGRAARQLVNDPEREGIPVCFTGIADTDARRWVRQALEGEWAAHSIVKFSGFAQCTSSFDWGISIELTTGGSAGGGGALPVAHNTITIQWASGPCAGAGREACIKSVALHEIGHTLGAQHPYIRPDAPARCRGFKDPVSWVTTMGEFDTDSVMMGANVCSTAPYATQLSQNDVWGISLLYGAPNARIGGSVPAWGGRFWWYDIDGDQRWDVERDHWTMYGDGTGLPVSGAWGSNASKAYIEKIGTYHDGQWRLDWNGDGVDNAGDKTFTFGGAGFVPVPGRYRGGPSLLAVYWAGYFYIDWNNNGRWDSNDKAELFRTAQAGDIPVVGAWTTNGVEKVGIYNNGDWRLDVNGDRIFGSGDKTYHFNPAGPNAKPIAEDFRNVGKAQIAVLDGEWLYIDWNGNGKWDGSSDRAHWVGTDMSGMDVVAGRWHRHPTHRLSEQHYDFKTCDLCEF